MQLFWLQINSSTNNHWIISRTNDETCVFRKRMKLAAYSGRECFCRMHELRNAEFSVGNGFGAEMFAMQTVRQNKIYRN